VNSLICGQVGCGRYDEAHAYAHFEHTDHAFAMDIKTQAIWDYTNDEWVHRLIQNTLDGKLVELPSAAGSKSGAEAFMTKDKLEDISMEYTSMMKGQLDSQRSYFEEQVDRAVDKAAEAAISADHAAAAALKANERLDSMQAAHQMLLNETLPGLEKGKERAEKRAEKFESMARTMEKDWKEKEVINDSLMERIGFLEKQINELTVKNSDLEEQNRDLTFFISGTQRLKGQGEDVQEGTLEIADPPAASKKKKGKGRK